MRCIGTLLMIMAVCLALRQPADAQILTPIDFSSQANIRLQDALGPDQSNLTGGILLPDALTGHLTLGGVPFNLPTAGNAQGKNAWNALIAGGNNPRVLDISLHIHHPTTVYTLINDFWGIPGPQSYAYLEFFGTNGAYYRKDLVSGVDIRDFNSNTTYPQTINGTTTTQVLTYDTFGTGQWLDRQRIDLPSAFSGADLLEIRLTDVGRDFDEQSFNNGDRAFQRVFLSGLTVASMPDNDPDLNGDGSHDLIWQNSVTGDVTTWYLNGPAWPGTYDFLAHTVPTQWKIVGSADLDFDSNTDLIWQNSQTGDVTVWYMNGAQWTGRWDYLGKGVPIAWKIAGIADLNADGKPDLIWQNTSTGDVIYWIMDGIAQKSTGFIAHNVALAWKIVGTADMNGDGKPDLVWQNTSTGDVTVWYLNGAVWSGNWDYIAQGIPPAWKIAAIMDTNHDGKADLIWQNTSTGDVTVWYMNGAVWMGTWAYLAHGVPANWKIVRTH